MSLRRAMPALIAAGLAAAYLLLRPPSADLAAHTFRAWLFDAVGFTVWNGQWFGGHHVPGFSILFPPLAALLGPRVVAALTCVVSAVLFERLARERFGERARLGAAWFGAATATNLFTGRLTFALGVAVGLGALLAHQRRRGVLAALLAAACPLASPVAGLFLVLAGVAHYVGARRRGALVLAAVALGSDLLLQVAFPENGIEPFVFSAFWPVPAFCAALLVLAPREERTFRAGAALYAVAALAAFALETPMGGNVTRLGTLFGGPVLALVLWRRRSAALAVLALPLLYWQWYPPVRDLGTAAGDPAIESAYYAPLNRYLGGHATPGVRVEIPLTRNHWENVWVARRFPLARGWERQLDVKLDRLFYEPRLDPARYRAWLDGLAVAYVAVPDARLDYTGIPEARLVRAGLPYLRPVWRSRHWRVYGVEAPLAPASPPARVVSMSPDAFAVRTSRAGAVLVRVRHTPYWQVTDGDACVKAGSDGLTRLVVRRPGYVRVAARFSLGRLLDPGDDCTR
jgi:hypothetical protein